jgi:hypothetical protein
MENVIRAEFCIGGQSAKVQVKGFIKKPSKHVRPASDKVERGLKIVVVDPDDDYLGIEVCAASDRYAGATRIYAGLDQLSEFASQIEGFPTTSKDNRRYEFGSTESGIAGGYVCLHFYCVDGAGHAVIEVTIEDDDQLHTQASAKFSFRIEPAELDRFLLSLRSIEQERFGEAELVGLVF